MSFAGEIQNLRDEGYSDEDLLGAFIEMNPSYKDSISQLQSEDFSAEDIISTYIESEGGQQQQEAPQNLLAQTGRGVLQGGGDAASLGGLVQAGLQAPLTYGLLSPEEREIAATPGMEARAQLETDPTISVMDWIALAGDDDLIGDPILPGQRKKLREATAKIPEGGLPQELVRRGTRSLLAAPLGPTAMGTAITSEVTGLAAKELVKKAGGGEGLQTTADILFGFVDPRKAGAKIGQKLAGKTASKVPQQAEKAIPRVAREAETRLAKADIVASPKKVQNEINQLSSEAIKKYEGMTGKLGENTFSGKNLNARHIEDKIVSETKDAALKSIYPEYTTTEKTWEKISSGVNENLSKARDSYRKLYKASAKQAAKMEGAFPKTQEAIRDLQKELGKITTKSGGQPQVEKALTTSLSDITGSKESGNLLQSLTGITHKMPLDKAISLKRVLNDVINYGELTPSIKDLLRPIVKSLKGETLDALGSRPLVKLGYTKAESQFAKTAETYGKDAIKFLRAKDAPETAASKFLVGSNVKYLKDSLKGNSEAWSALESQIVREISKKPLDPAREIYREVSPYLSSKSKEIAQDIMQMGDKLTSPGAQGVMRGKLLESLQKSSSTGERPAYALELMKNPTGYKFTENILKKSPKGKQMWKALQKQNIDDIFTSVMDSKNRMDWSKVKDLLKKPHVEKIIRDAVGKDGLDFFKNLEKYGENITTNLEKFAAKASPSAREKVVSAMGFALKSTLATMIGGPLGLAAYIGLKAAPKASSAMYYHILASPKLQALFKKLTNPGTWNSDQLLPTLSKINESLEEKE